MESAFTREEVWAAFKQMNVNSSPGPDGFGPGFYLSTWARTGELVLTPFDGFFNRQVDLDRINRSYLVLIPKNEGARTPDAFRPICLQNCNMKAITRVLTSRLQLFIPALVGGDQTGFIKKRCIAESYAYAMDILQCCHKRNVPTVVLKLDFRKAFDSVNWESMTAILRIRGFPKCWCSWMMDMLSTGKTSVLLNRVPGLWIDCKNGLRQGDPISPYLFIIVADVLCQLLRFRGHNSSLSHPILQGAPCPVLQYADDTIIFIKASSEAMVSLKRVLQEFAHATGLIINYRKTTFLSIGIEPDYADHLASLLDTTFPQRYLGLPLTPHKVAVSDFSPLIASCDRYLAGWKATLLNRVGRLTLCSSILSALPLHYMSALQIPRSVIKAIDRKRRAFFWTGEDLCHGSKCLVAWKEFCKSKEEGGLGLKNLETQNHCL
ncbi:LOW QUALITY PROTEIN: hypothetical protein U9M48_030493 [Paspalum notatum var. saurae]|uniref:Reverse transcriptase domain-containing protein n=1 Tax=Paspalum notatum var. saurae TaxID=547442 RepID=A0AAQ3U3P2_PASNO